MSEGRALRLPPMAVGIGHEEKEEIDHRWDTIDKIEKELTGKGFVESPMPQFGCPNISSELLTTPDSTTYTQAYSQLLGWYNYSSTHLARVQARILQFENIQENVKARLHKEFTDKNKMLSREDKMSADTIKAHITLDPQNQAVMLKLQELYQYKNELQAHVESIERSMRVVSRQIEIRKLDQEGQVRDGNVGRGRYPVPGRG